MKCEMKGHDLVWLKTKIAWDHSEEEKHKRDHGEQDINTCLFYMMACIHPTEKVHSCPTEQSP